MMMMIILMMVMMIMMILMMKICLQPVFLYVYNSCSCTRLISAVLKLLIHFIQGMEKRPACSKAGSQSFINS